MIRKSHLLIIDKQELLPNPGTKENGSEDRQGGLTPQSAQQIVERDQKLFKIWG
jgi:hypothetical protein